MRILHTSDWHLGIALNGLSLIAEQDNFIEQLTGIVRAERIDAVIVAGDVFDSSVSSSDAISLYNKAVTAICAIAPMIVIAGNHDGAARLAACRELLKSAGLYVTGKLTRDIEPVVIGGAAFYAIPYFNIDEARVFFPHITTYEQAFNAVCGQIRGGMDTSRVNIAVAHAFISGASLSDSDRAAILGTASMVSADVFAGFDYTALGHLHRPQNTGAAVRYSGSPLKYSFGEAGIAKSVTIFDTDTMETYTADITPLHGMRVITGGYEELLDGAEHSGDYIKIEITDRYVGLDALERFRYFYPNLLQISGKNAVGGESTLTAAEVESMPPRELLRKFFLETLQYEPPAEQADMFIAAMDKGEACEQL